MSLIHHMYARVAAFFYIAVEENLFDTEKNK